MGNIFRNYSKTASRQGGGKSLNESQIQLFNRFVQCKRFILLWNTALSCSETHNRSAMDLFGTIFVDEVEKSEFKSDPKM